MAQTSHGYVEVAPGVELHYQEAGSGQPLVCVPGWTFSSEVFVKQYEGLADRYRVIGVDPRGQGLSTKTAVGNTYGAHGRDLGTFLEKLDISGAVLIGWSTGCLEVCAMVRAHGLDRVRGFIGIDMSPKALSASAGDWVEGSIEEVAEVATDMLGSVEGQKGFVEWYATEVMIEHEPTADELAWITGDSLKTPPWIAHALWNSAMLSNYLKEAAELDAARPTHYVVAEHWAETAQAFLKTAMPRTETTVLGAHMMYWERPDEFNALVDRFARGL